MKISTTTKKLEKAGFTVSKNGGFFIAVKPGCDRLISYTPNGRPENDEVATLKVRHFNDHDDSMTDYSVGSFFDSVKQAIAYAVNG